MYCVMPTSLIYCAVKWQYQDTNTAVTAICVHNFIATL